MTDNALQPLSTSQLLDRTFSLYKDNFPVFAGIAALPPAMVALVQVLALPLGNDTTAAKDLSVAVIVVAAIIAIVFVIIYLLGLALANGATVFAVSRLHLGSSASIGESYKIVRPLLGRIINIVVSASIRSMGPALLAYLVFLLLIVGSSAGMRSLGGAGGAIFGLLFLAAFGLVIAGGIWSFRLYLSYSLAIPVCIVEKLRAKECLRRSKILTKGSLTRIFLVYLLFGIITFAFSLVLSIPNYLDVATHEGVQTLPFKIWSVVADFLSGTLAGPVATIAVALLYYDERVRKEAFDLQLMMESMRATGPSQPHPAPAPPSIS
ncbi:MAG TPA: hypothetical protein VEW69_05240 [Alphaproteobacteria bacterium]|nr:hypothetical protein [Alphaproteobacteria bacterium]